MRRKFYYHCSSEWHGETFEPLRRTPDEMSKREPSTPRLCVCPTIAGCFSARMMELNRPAYVYKTIKPYRSIAPRNVWDEIVTRERWLIPPVTLIHVATINAMAVNRIYRPIVRYHKLTKKCSDLIVRLAQLVIAHEVLDGPVWERNLIERWKRRFKITDAEEFLARRAYDATHKAKVIQ